MQQMLIGIIIVLGFGGFMLYNQNVTLKENNAKLIQKKTIMPLITYTHPLKKKDSYINDLERAN